MQISPKEYPSLIAKLSPQRFYRFVRSVLEDQPETESEKRILCTATGAQILLLKYEFEELSISASSYLGHSNAFLVSHHVPSLMTHKPFFEVYQNDIESITDADVRSKLKTRSGMSATLRGPATVYYVTNYNFHSDFDRDRERFLGRLQEIAIRCSISALPIDPVSFSNKADEHPEVKRHLISALSQMDGYAISLSPAGIAVFPFACHDVYKIDQPASALMTFNILASHVAAPIVESLYGLQDLIHLSPKEVTSENYLLENKNLWMGSEYLDVKPQIVLGPNGDKPDFFLETSSHVWEALEIKLPQSSRFLYSIDGNRVVLRARR